jgi:hypothetical protein
VDTQHTTQRETERSAVDVFVSHVAEDKTVALNLALRLEEAGYSTWCYELDSSLVAGSEDEQVHAALTACRAILVVISPDSLGESGMKVRNEVNLAVSLDERKSRLFVLHGVDHGTFQRHTLTYRLGIPVTIALPPLVGAEGVLPLGALGQVPEIICDDLDEAGIRPGERNSERIEDLSRHLRGLPPNRGKKQSEQKVRHTARLLAVPIAAVLISVLAGTPVGPATLERLRMLLSRESAVCVMPTKIIPEGSLEAMRPDAETLHTMLDTYLTKILKPPWKVVAKAKIDAIAGKGEKSPFEVAEDLGVTRKIEPRLLLEGDGRRLFINIIEPSGNMDTSLDETFVRHDVIAMARWAVRGTAKALQPDLDEKEIGRVLMQLTATTSRREREAYDAMYGDEEEPPVGPGTPHAGLGFGLVAVAHAADDIERVIEEFRTALEAGDVARMAPLFVSMPDRQREALQKYFDGTRELQIRFDRPDVTTFPDGTAFVTFMRHDTFRDRETGERVELSVRVNASMVQQQGAWKIQGFKRPS